jgi:hypothetical protein
MKAQLEMRAPQPGDVPGTNADVGDLVEQLKRAGGAWSCKVCAVVSGVFLTRTGYLIVMLRGFG